LGAFARERREEEKRRRWIGERRVEDGDENGARVSAQRGVQL